MSWRIAYTLLGFGYYMWTFAYIARSVLRGHDRRPPGIVNWVFFEIRPFFPALCVAMFLAGTLANGTHGAGIRAFALIAGLVNWWYSRRDKDDDDRWKRRREALSARVAQVGARLAVVPT
jgi:hypothetical protein